MSHYIKHEILEPYLDATTEDAHKLLDFMLHDFGMRGSTGMESAGKGGGAHLLSFKGTDNTAALQFIINLYSDGDSYMPGFSIDAAEHSTIISWGRENEKEAMRHAIENMREGKPLSLIADSFNIYDSVAWLGKYVKENNIKSTLVIRPDSGNPIEVVPKILDILGNTVGREKNSKGYYMLPDNVRVIQGDGVNYKSIENILKAITEAGWATGNITLGSGGGLLQEVTRDKFGIVYKACAVKRNGIWRGVYKDPIHSGKKSKQGMLKLIEKEGRLQTVAAINEDDMNKDNLLKIIYKDGKIQEREMFETVRKRANKRFSR